MKMLKILSVMFLMTSFVNEGRAQEKNWVGTWQYAAPQAGYQYQQGKIIFSMEEKDLKVFVEINGHKIEAQNVEVAENKVSFNVTIEGGLIKVSLQEKDKDLTGNATYSGGKIPITGKKLD